ncbi:MAG: mechanosensitive ion channel [Desulfamplus sp.]|nr:mechanosensitive ion channel [Desulfamplus sp.]
METLLKQLILSSFILIASFIFTPTLSADEPDEPQRLNSNPTDVNTTAASTINEIKKILEQSALIEKTLEMEAKENNDLSSYLEDIRKKKTEFESQTNVYKIELTTFSNQLHLPDIETKLIEKAYMSSQAAVAKINKDISALNQKSEQLKQTLQISYEQKMGNDKFLMELESSPTYNIEIHKSSLEQSSESKIQNNEQKDAKESKTQNKTEQPKQDIKSADTISEEQKRLDSAKQQLGLGKHGDPQQIAALEQRIAFEQQQAEEQRVLDAQKESDKQKSAESHRAALSQLQIHLKYLQTALTRKILLIQSIYSIINEELPVLEEIAGKYKTLVSDLEIRLRDAKKAELLTRTTNPLTQDAWKRLGEDISQLNSIGVSMFELESWKDTFSFLWLSGLHKLIAFIVILLIAAVIGIRLKILIKKFCALSPHLEKRYWSRIVLEIFTKNLLLSVITAFLYLCVKFRLFFSYSILANLIVEILMIMIFILWTIYFLEHIQKIYPATPSKELIIFLRWLNVVAIIYIMLGSALRIDSSIIIAYRLMCEIIFYGWLVYFLKKLMPAMTRYCEKQNKTIQMVPAFYKNGLIIAAITGIVLELLGYGTLAFYWYTSWGKTIVVLMWSGLIISASKEWIDEETSDSTNVNSSQSQGQHAHTKTGISMLWLTKKIAFAIMFFIVTITLMLSWASSDFVFAWLYKIFTFTFTVGSMNFSISTTVQAMLILLATHFFAKAWRSFFQKNFLEESGLDHGLQESMTSITVYAIWIFGIFTSLIVFGLNTTTLTVAFGALSIGIGFGLQNIVSNFISGIILLFERPIQVGDDIEINGTWATIKKTNVRSTIAQTYDNATIIIPNSELITNRVINWSFKDKRLRRKIKVGVEYGSDIALVKKTLIEIAGTTPRVLKFPEADVLFEDFADSALMFTLRFWTFTDCFMTVETDIRFKVEKLFKEREIVIAFPQHDINIRSMPINFMAQVQQQNVAVPQNVPAESK